MSNKPSGMGIGVNPIPYDFDKFKEYDQNGKLITNETISNAINVLKDLYNSTPAFISYSKEMIDSHVKKSLSGLAETEEEKRSAQLYSENDADYLAVVRIQSGFFEDHSILIKKINILNNKIQTEYSATDNAGNLLSNLSAIEYIVNNIVLMLIYEDLIRTEISEERERRIAG